MKPDSDKFTFIQPHEFKGRKNPFFTAPSKHDRAPNGCFVLVGLAMAGTLTSFLQLINVIDWPMWVVTLPFWIVPAIVAGLAVLFTTAAVAAVLCVLTWVVLIDNE